MSVSFTTEQLEIIHVEPKSNLKVIAVPGSGKSTVLVYRVDYLMKNGISADNMLAIMFNDSATVNFKQDLSSLEFMNLPEVKTYHSYARKLGFILEKLGLKQKSKFTPNQYQYREFYKNSLIKFIPMHLHKPLDIKSPKTVSLFIQFVELCKSSLMTPEEVFKQFKFPLTHYAFVEGFHSSEQERHAQNIQFFSDLIYDLVVFCKENPAAIDKISNKHDVLLVDEYQDANAACHELIKVIAGTRAKVNVVGDDDQTIYDFTGANPKFLKEVIDTDFDNVKTFKLTNTFRFGHSVALIANNIISNNDYRIDKLCVSGRPDLETKISTARYSSLHMDIEQTELMQEITSNILDGGKHTDIAILVRNYSSTFCLELALLKQGIPYFISKENKTILHSDDVGFLVGVTAAIDITLDNEGRREGLSNYLKAYLWLPLQLDLTDAIGSLLNKDLNSAVNSIGKHLKALDSDAVLALTRRMKAFDAVMRSKDKTVSYRLNRLLKEAGIFTLLNRKKTKGDISPLKRFEAIFNFYISLADEPSEIIVLVDTLKEMTSQNDRNQGVNILTLHKSKGLAWPVVIMAYCEEGVCPSLECGSDLYQVEVERRLFYVGVTRARRKLIFHIPNDEKLVKSLINFDGYMNDVDYFNKGYASRFMYETNLISATRIAAEIFHNDKRSTISATGNRHNYNRYLNALHLPYRISGLKEYL